MDLYSMYLGKVEEAQHLVFGADHHRGELRNLRLQLVGSDAPLGVLSLGGLLRKDRIDKRKDHLPLTLVGIGQGVAQEMHATALPTPVMSATFLP